MLRHEQTRTSLPSVCSLSLARRLALEATSWSCYVITLVNPGRRVRCAFCTAGDRPIALASEGTTKPSTSCARASGACTAPSSLAWRVQRACCAGHRRASRLFVSVLACTRVRGLSSLGSVSVGCPVGAYLGVPGGGLTTTLATIPTENHPPHPPPTTTCPTTHPDRTPTSFPACSPTPSPVRGRQVRRVTARTTCYIRILSSWHAHLDRFPTKPSC